jgi:hypothetical protein
MSIITEDTSTIDEKKAKKSGTSTTSLDFKGFISNYLSSIIFTIGISIFIFGTLGLYTTKVAQANILPDNIELAPYTIIDRVVKEIPIDINIMRTSFFSENKDTLSQKAVFNSQEYLDSFNRSFLCSLKKSAEPSSGLFANAPLFFSNVYDNLIAKNFLVINTIFFYLSYLPESIIMLLYGIFGIFIWIGLYFFNVCISIFYHIVNIPQLFRSTSAENDKQWETIENTSFLRFVKLILFFFIWIPVGILSAFIVPSFFTLYCLISPLYTTYKIKQTNKIFNIIDFIKDTFVYKKFFFFVLATLSLFSNGIKHLGNNAIVGIIVAVIFAYFMGLYTNEMPESGADGFTLKIKQTMKQASLYDNDLKNAQLVEICQQIPVDDKKMNEIIQYGKFRKLTKPTIIGGEGDGEEGIHIIKDSVINNTYQPSNQLIQNNSISRLDTLKNELDLLQNQLNDSVQDISGGRQNYENLKLELEPQIAELKNQIQAISQEIPQLGGRKNKHVKTHKKYNIRWV